MIPTKPTTRQFNRMVKNILDTYHAATPEQIKEGTEWYPVAHDIARHIANGDVAKGAGVIAVLSARNSWERNVLIATESFATGTPTGHTRANLEKARRIMSGESPESVLPMTLKTGQFYACILDPADPDAVVIDRHAHDVAAGRRYGDKENRGLSSRGRYNVVADAYREAAKTVGVSPSTLQAIVWVVQVDNYRWSRN